MQKEHYNPNRDMAIARIIALLAILFLLYSFHHGDGGYRCDAIDDCTGHYDTIYVD